jgi:hypothetical protein
VAELRIGQTVILRHGPFEAEWKVVGITDVGAQLEINEEPSFVGFADVQSAPSGAPLTRTRFQDFIGRAHWGAVERYQSWPGYADRTVVPKEPKGESL